MIFSTKAKSKISVGFLLLSLLLVLAGCKAESDDDSKGTKPSASYTLKYDANVGEGSVTGTVAAKTVPKGESVKVENNAFVRDGYFFTGWNTKNDGTGTSYSEGEMLTPEASITLYAQWEEIAENSYVVTFIVDGAIFKRNQIASGGKVVVPSQKPIKEGSTFLGWFISNDDGVTLSETAFDFDSEVISENLTLYAKWGYTVTFKSNEGSAVSAQTVLYGGKAEKPDDPTRDGHDFKGWFTSGDEGVTLSETAFDFDSVLTSNITLYAKWEVKGFKVTFMNGDTVVKEETVAYGKKATAPTVSKENASFENWYKDAAFTTLFDVNEPITEETTGYVRWQYVVTFDIGDESSYEKQTVKDGETVRELDSNPEKANVKFGGWYTDKDYTSVFTFGQAVNANTTVYAKWLCEVTFMDGETKLDVKHFTLGTKITAPENTVPTDGWYTDKDYTNKFDFDTLISANITLYARWTYKIIYKPNAPDGKTVSGTMAEQTVTKGKSENLSALAFSIDDYEFTGWNTAADGSGTSYTAEQTVTPSGDLELYAQWTEKKAGFYAVTFNTNGGFMQETVQQVAAGEKVAKPADPEKSGATFEGWYEDSQFNTEFNFDSAINKRTTVYARWSYKVTFATNGGTSVEVKTVKDGESWSLPSTSRTDAAFEGWYKDTEFTVAYTTPSALTENITLYARWKYTVTLDVNGGTAIDAITVKDGEGLTLPVPVRNGAAFEGWYTDTTYTVKFGTKVTANATAHARWSYTVTFDSNGGVGNMASQTFFTDESKTLTRNAFTKEGYLFAGWTSVKDGTEIIFDSAAVNFGKNTTLYAKWEEPKVTITVDTSDLTVQVDDIGTSVMLTAKDGYKKYTWTVGGKSAVDLIDGATLSPDGTILTIVKAKLDTSIVDQIVLSAENGNGIKYMTTISVSAQ